MKEYMKQEKKTFLCKSLVCVILYDQLYLVVEKAAIPDIKKILLLMSRILITNAHTNIIGG